MRERLPNGRASESVTPVAPIISFVSVNATATEAPRSRGGAALSRHRRSRKICRTDRGAFRVHHGCVGTIVPVGVDTFGGVERPYVAFDHVDRRLGRFGCYREALRAAASRGRAS
jgi:hypothetical protein